MNILALKKTIKSRESLKKLFVSFLNAFGFLAILLGVADILFPNTFGFKFNGLFVFGAISLIWAIINVIPKFEISRDFSVPDIKITIKIGDIFNENANLIIGMNDVFDTEKGVIIKPKSIQGQFLTKVFNDDKIKLDKEIKTALNKIIGKKDPDKKQGKNIRYPIGTVATLSVGNKKYFCSAYSFMGNNLKAQSSIHNIFLSLESLWSEIRLKGQCDDVAIPVIGTDLARTTNTASYSNLIKLIITSFVVSSREAMITKHLKIIIYPDDIKKINLLEIENFLETF